MSGALWRSPITRLTELPPSSRCRCTPPLGESAASSRRKAGTMLQRPVYAGMEPHENTESRQLVPLTSDLVFKYVFGSEHSTRYLRSLLSAIQEDAGIPCGGRREDRQSLQPAGGERRQVIGGRRARDRRQRGRFYHRSAVNQPPGVRLAGTVLLGEDLQMPSCGRATSTPSLKRVVGNQPARFPSVPGGRWVAPLHTTFVPSCVQTPNLTGAD
jgi:hypothetical protein